MFCSPGCEADGWHARARSAAVSRGNGGLKLDGIDRVLDIITMIT